MNRSLAYALGILLLATFVIVVVRTDTGNQSMTQAETVDRHTPGPAKGNGSWKHTNALAQETSPYLLQHAHNPVNWYPWGTEAFELARRTGKPIFLSVGYSTCYWCHVMERKVFEIEEIAALMNEHFVNIKVDREERPDVDDIYMLAVQMMTQGRGGWPMSVFLTPPGAQGPDDPGLQPFYAGTYFPPKPQHGRPSFPQILTSLASAWKNQHDNVLKQADSVATTVAGYLSQTNPPGPVNSKMVETVARQLLNTYDSTHGGFGSAPKFPQPDNLLFLLTVYRNSPNEELWKAVSYTLDRMARGGMYDQIGGGFHRYSTDEKWLVPHFEKMLYDNGQLLETYCAAQAIKAPDSDPGYYTRIIRHICEYVLREMTDPTGTFWSAQDAEVDSREGGNYVWTSRELEEAIGDKAITKLASRMYGFDAGTNFRDPHDPDADWVNVVFLPKPLHELTEPGNMTLQTLLDRKADIDTCLFKVRSARKQPRTDDKVVVSWNGLMIAGMARASRTLADPRYTAVAAKASNYILDNMRTDDGGLYRTMRQGRKKIPGFLDDYAFFAHGLLELYRSDVTSRWLDAATEIVKIARERFAAEHGGYFDTLEGQGDLFTRTRGKSDGALPSGNSQMVHNLLDLHDLTGQKAYLDQAVTDLRSFSVDLKEQGMGMTHMCHALLRAIEAAPERFTEPDDAAGASGQPVRVRVEPRSVKATKNGATIRVFIDIDESHHINAHDVGLDGPVPTRVELRQGHGLTLQISYPPGQPNHYGFAKGPVNVYEGTVVIEATLHRSSDASGDVPRLTMTYQACTDRACLEPKTVELPVTIG